MDEGQQQEAQPAAEVARLAGSMAADEEELRPGGRENRAS